MPQPDGGQFARLIAELRELPVPAGVHAALADVLRRFDGTRISGQVLVQEERVTTAARLLAAGNERAIVRDRLANLYRVSRRTATRDIGQALARRCPPPPPAG